MEKKKLLVAALLAMASSVAVAQTDSTSVDSVTWSKDLDGVTVVHQKRLVKMEADKMTYKVSEDVDAKASTVLDMLRKVPMVTVDAQDNITVNGSSSFKVYINGKTNPMFASNASLIFKNMPATMVKDIEVITNPGAKYDAEGASGVLNIVLNNQGAQGQQSMDGYNGSVRATAGNKSLGGGLFLSGQKGRFSYSGNLLENYSTPGTTKVASEQQNGLVDILTKADSKTRVPFTMGSLSLGYELDSMSAVNVTAELTTMNLRVSGPTSTQMLGGAYTTPFEYSSDMRMKNRNTSFSGSADYQRFFNKERTRSITLTYQLGYSPTKAEQTYDFETAALSLIDLTDRYSLNKEKTTEHTLQADYTTPTAEGQTLNVGAKVQYRRASSDAKYYLQDVYDATSSLDYLYKNTIAAAYAEYEARISLLTAKGGLRYEQTHQDVEYRLGQGQDFTKNYGNLVPSVSLSMALGPTQNVGLNYNMRIARPGITYLNPYVNKSDPNSLIYGNTDLDVEKSNNFSLVFNSFSSRFMMNLSLTHSYTGNAIEQYSFYDSALLNTTYGNIVKKRQTGLNGYVNWLLHQNTRLFLNGGFSYVDLRSTPLQAKNSGWQGNAMVGVQQTLPWQLKAGLYLITNTKTYTLQGWSGGFNMVVANLSRSFFKDKLTLSLSGMSGLSDGGNLKFETYSRGASFLAHQTIKVPMQGFTFNVTYTFGNTNRQARQHTSRVQNDYIEQKSQGEVLNSVGTMQ